MDSRCCVRIREVTEAPDAVVRITYRQLLEGPLAVAVIVARALEACVRG
jgi:hypothetical protein